METDLVRNALSMSTESTKNVYGYAQTTNIFHGYAIDYMYKQPCKEEQFIRKTVTVEEKTLEVQSGVERVLGSHWLWPVVIGCNCKKGVNKFSHRIQNSLLLVTEPLTRDYD
jgi:hypothetical protein